MNNKFKSYKSYLFSKCKERRKLFNHLGIILFVLTILQALTPFLFRVIIDLGRNRNDYSFLNVIFIGYFVLILSIAFGNIVKNYYSLLLSSQFKSELIYDYVTILLSKVNSLTMLSFGKLQTKIGDLGYLSSFITTNTVYFVNAVFMTVIYSCILLIFSKSVFVIFILFLILSFFWEYIFISYKKLIELKLREGKIRENNYWYDLLNNIYDIKVYNKEKKLLNTWEKDNNEFEDSIFKNNVTKSKHEFGTFMLNGTKNIAILYLCVHNTLEGEMTMGTLISIQFIIGFLNNPVTSFINFLASYEIYKISLEEINASYTSYEFINSDNSIAISNEIKLIELYKVKLVYPGGNNYVISGITLKLTPGKKYAIVGRSGSGKSSLLKLLLGLYAPSEGIIKINAVESTEINLESYRSHFSCVLQESRLIKGTIVENIVYYNENVDYNWLDKVIKLTNLEDVISNYKKGMFDVINNDSKGISEGQKQRILLARALYQNKDFIVLDEATNSLDLLNEYVIFNNIRSHYKEKTMIVCTHNISLIKDFDMIFFVNKGIISEYGTHDQLVDRRGLYNIMLNAQTKMNNHV